MKRKYEVLGRRFRAPDKQLHEKGSAFETDAPLPQEGILVEAGVLRIIGSEKIACPACSEQDSTKTKANTPKLDNYDQLAEHYASEHAGLAVPPPEEV